MTIFGREDAAVGDILIESEEEPQDLLWYKFINYKVATPESILCLTVYFMLHNENHAVLKKTAEVVAQNSFVYCLLRSQIR